MQSTAVSYEFSGFMTLYGSTIYLNSNLGTIDIISGVDDAITESGVIFSSTPAPATVVVIPAILLPNCCSVPISAVLEMKTNLTTQSGIIVLNHQPFVYMTTVVGIELKTRS